MSMTITLDQNVPTWNLKFSEKNKAEPSKIEKSIKEAVDALNTAFSLAKNDLSCKVHPLLNDETYDKVYTIYKLIKNIESSLGKEQVEEKKCLETLKRCAMSLKIGGAIKPQDLENNPDFEKFIKANFWHNKSYHYKHVLPMIDGEPGIFFEGNQIKFSEFCQMRNTEGKLFIDDKTKKLIEDACIIQEGVISKAQHNVQEIFPHKLEDPSTWGNQHIFEIVTFVKKETELFNGNHTLLRLRTDDGEVYSWGVVRPSISFWEGLKQRGTMMLNGAPECPDQFESLEKNDFEILATQIPITSDQFELVRGNLNKMNKEGVPFMVLSGLTCQGHVVHQAEQIGIKIISEMSIASLVGKSLFGKNIQKVWSAIVPKFIRVTFKYIADFFLGLIMRLASIHAQDPKVKEIYGNEFDHFLHGFFNVFKPVQVQHPHAMRKWQQKVVEFRKSDEGQKLGPYAIPPEFVIK